MADNGMLDVRLGRDVDKVVLLARPLHFRLAISIKVLKRSVWRCSYLSRCSRFVLSSIPFSVIL